MTDEHRVPKGLTESKIKNRTAWWISANASIQESGAVATPCTRTIIATDLYVVLGNCIGRSTVCTNSIGTIFIQSLFSLAGKVRLAVHYSNELYSFPGSQSHVGDEFGYAEFTFCLKSFSLIKRLDISGPFAVILHIMNFFMIESHDLSMPEIYDCLHAPTFYSLWVRWCLFVLISPTLYRIRPEKQR